MTVKLVDARDVTGSFVSTISEPDLSAGEVEWGNLSTAIKSSHIMFKSCEFNGGVLGIEYNLATVSLYDDRGVYQSFFFDVSPQMTSPFGIEFVNGYIYILDNNTSNIFVYDSSGIYTGNSFSVSVQVTDASCLYYDGEYLCVFDSSISTISVYKYTEKGAFVENKTNAKNVFAQDANFHNGQVYITSTFNMDVVVTDKDMNIDRSFPVAGDGTKFDCFVYTSVIVKDVVMTARSTSSGGNVYYIDEYLPSGAYGGVARAGDQFIVPSLHALYKSTALTQDDPELGALLSPPTWVEIGSTNKWAILDSSTSQKSIFGTSGSVTVSVGAVAIDTVGLFGIAGIDSIKLEIKDGVTVLYTDTESTFDPSGIFAGLLVKEMLFEGLPPYTNVDIVVSFTGDDCQVGRFAIGNAEGLGEAVAGTSLGEVDYSTLEYDEFGNVTYRERPIVPYHTYQVDVAKSLSHSVSRKIQSVSGRDAIWIAEIGMDEPLVAFGRAERAPITYDNPSIVSYSIKVRGSA